MSSTERGLRRLILGSSICKRKAVVAYLVKQVVTAIGALNGCRQSLNSLVKYKLIFFYLASSPASSSCLLKLPNDVKEFLSSQPGITGTNQPIRKSEFVKCWKFENKEISFMIAQ